MTTASSLPSARDDNRILRQNARSWQEGYRAGLRQARLADCPYTIGTNESWSWSSGYIEGKAARLESCQCKIDVNRKH
jgi:ribosome modulation factor